MREDCAGSTELQRHVLLLLCRDLLFYKTELRHDCCQYWEKTPIRGNGDTLPKKLPLAEKF